MTHRYVSDNRAAGIRRAQPVEWQTLALIAGCYGAWAFCVFLVAPVSLPVAILGLAGVIALHSSLQHELLHGHPFRSQLWNGALVFPAVGLFIPYLRFRDTHLAHHKDENLTDPYDDPESNYLDPGAWDRTPRWLRAVLAANNTLLGRMLLGPVIGQVAFMRSDALSILAGDWRVAFGWALHVPAVISVLLVLSMSQMPLWAYCLSAYFALSILKIRTFLEHQAHERVHGRTVVIEDRGVLAFLFLNNNLHVVHHLHPSVPWYRLWALYQSDRDRYLTCNDGYRFTSYADVFARFFLRAKDPVPHPLRRK